MRILTASSSTFLSDTVFVFVFSKCILVKNIMAASTVWCCRHDMYLGASGFLHYCFVLSTEMLAR